MKPPASTPAAETSLEPEKWSLIDLLLRMKLSSLWFCLAALLAMLAGAFALGEKVSALHLPSNAQVVPTVSQGKEPSKPQNKIELFAFHTGDRPQPFGAHFNCGTDDVAPKQVCGTRPVVDVKRIAAVGGGHCGFAYYVVACSDK